MLLFQRCREETIQGNDYYIILKEYGLEKAEAAPSHVRLADRSPGLHEDAALRPWARDSWALRARGGDAALRSHSPPPRPVRKSGVSKALCFALSSCLQTSTATTIPQKQAPNPVVRRTQRFFIKKNKQTCPSHVHWISVEGQIAPLKLVFIKILKKGRKESTPNDPQYSSYKVVLFSNQRGWNHVLSDAFTCFFPSPSLCHPTTGNK